MFNESVTGVINDTGSPFAIYWWCFCARLGIFVYIISGLVLLIYKSLSKTTFLDSSLTCKRFAYCSMKPKEPMWGVKWTRKK